MSFFFSILSRIILSDKAVNIWNSRCGQRIGQFSFWDRVYHTQDVVYTRLQATVYITPRVWYTHCYQLQCISHPGVLYTIAPAIRYITPRCDIHSKAHQYVNHTSPGDVITILYAHWLSGWTKLRRAASNQHAAVAQW